MEPWASPSALLRLGFLICKTIVNLLLQPTNLLGANYKPCSNLMFPSGVWHFLAKGGRCWSCRRHGHAFQEGTFTQGCSRKPYLYTGTNKRGRDQGCLCVQVLWRLTVGALEATVFWSNSDSSTSQQEGRQINFSYMIFKKGGLIIVSTS